MSKFPEKLTFPTGFTNTQCRNKAQSHHSKFNGEYIYQLCRKCGRCWFDNHGKTSEAKVVETCKECP